MKVICDGASKASFSWKLWLPIPLIKLPHFIYMCIGLILLFFIDTDFSRFIYTLTVRAFKTVRTLENSSMSQPSTDIFYSHIFIRAAVHCFLTAY